VKAAIYARVSTTDQNCELQLNAVREYIVRHGWENAGEYVDTGWSGVKASSDHWPDQQRRAKTLQRAFYERRRIQRPYASAGRPATNSRLWRTKDGIP
jgi:hypothetical protein